MTLWHDSGIPEALVVTNGAMAAHSKSGRGCTNKQLTDAEMALWQLGDRIRVYFENKDKPSTPKRAG